MKPMKLPTLAPDFWTSKTTLAALVATLGVGVVCYQEHRLPTQVEVGAVWAAWMLAFHRDSVAKAATGTLRGQPGDATPVTTTQRSPEAP
jgi:hypothetical protein